MKRVFDIVLSIVGLVALSPLLAAIGLLILVLDGRPILFRQRRIGQWRKPFMICKFRTMVPNADELGKPLTVGADPRITRCGVWLRRTKLDELLQLWNVLVGEMSFVGPRPEVPCYVDLCTPDYERVLELVPGITDAASIRFRNESELLAGADNPEQVYLEQIVPEKIRLNLEYASQANVIRDCGVILRTIVKLGTGLRKQNRAA